MVISHCQISNPVISETGLSLRRRDVPDPLHHPAHLQPPHPPPNPIPKRSSEMQKERSGDALTRTCQG